MALMSNRKRNKAARPKGPSEPSAADYAKVENLAQAIVAAVLDGNTTRVGQLAAQCWGSGPEFNALVLGYLGCAVVEAAKLAEVSPKPPGRGDPSRRTGVKVHIG